MAGFYRYLITKFLFFIVTFFVSLTLIFIIPRIAPGNPIQQIIAAYAGGGLSPELLSQYQRQLIASFDLDKPLHVQYLLYIQRLFRGDLGISISSFGEPVTNLIMRHLPWTLILLVPATIVSWIIGNIWGALAAYKRNSLFEKISLAVNISISQIPYYWLAMTLIFVFAVILELFPTGSAYDPTMSPSLSLEFIASVAHHYVLPFLSLVIPSVGGWFISMRVLASGELGSGYIRFSEALGVDEKTVFRYVLRNSMLPQVTGLSIQLGTLIGGQIITESIFNYQGMGILLARALGARDYPLIQGVFLILILSLLTANFIVDFIYVLIDPRIRLGERKE